MKATKFIWKNGTLIPWEEANTHVLTHALHYGTGVFEGIRAYDTPDGPAIFRAREHYQRLIDSGKIYRMKSPYTVDDLIDANKQLMRENGIGACYIRPLIYYGFKEMGLHPGNNPIDVIIACWEWGTYLGEEGLKKGIRCGVSSWNRIDTRSLPPQAKCCGNYPNSVLAKMEAIDHGYDEAILMNINGTVAEGPGENLFMLKDGILFTPPLSDNVLKGITRQSIIELAKDLGITVVERSILRDEIFVADELFFTGTAAEVTPIREVNGRVIGEGSRGPVTEKIQNLYFDCVKGKNPDYKKWLETVS